MAERLTDKHTVSVYNNSNSEIYLGGNEEATKYIYKLAQLEDIMDKYGIESVELLEHIIKKGIVINSTIEDFAKEEFDKMKQDRNTWKRACELACREAPLHCPNPPEYYNAQNEYGSDEPYYIQESACEFSDDAERCLECQINYFYQQAKKEKDGDNNDTNN